MGIEYLLDRLKINLVKAEQLAVISKLSYLRKTDNTIDTDSILEQLKGTDQRYYSVKPFNKKSSQAIFILHPDFNVLAFTGTDEIKDWLDNARIRKIKMLNGRIHKGFYLAVKDIWQEILQYWNSLAEETRTKPLYLTGHSLGGAMANIAILLLDRDLKVKPKKCYTFGQPKIGNKLFSRNFNSIYADILYRFHNTSDIVPLLPSVLFGYYDCGANLYLEQSGKINYDRNVSIFEQTYKHVIATFNDLFALQADWIKDHDIDRYVEFLNNYNRNKS